MAFPYYAVVRLENDNQSKCMTFEAGNLTAALNEMARKAGVPSTHELNSYTLYEIVENGDGYKPVAEKWDKEKKAERLRRMGVVINTDDLNKGVPAEVKTTLPVVVTSISELEYESYEVEVV